MHNTGDGFSADSSLFRNTDALCLSCSSALMKGKVDPCVVEGGHVFTFSVSHNACFMSASAR